MNALRKSISLAIFSTAAAIGTLAAETGEASDQETDAGGETQMQEAMSEFETWRQNNSERGSSASSGEIDWNAYTSDSGWSTGLSRDTGSHRMVSGLSSGSILGSQSIIEHSTSSSSSIGNQAHDRPSPASSIVSEFSQIGRGETGGSSSAASSIVSEFSQVGRGETGGSSSAFTRAGSSASEQQNTLSRRSSGSRSTGSAMSTSRAATTEASTTEASTTSPDQFTPSQPRRTRSATPNYLGY